MPFTVRAIARGKSESDKLRQLAEKAWIRSHTTLISSSWISPSIDSRSSTGRSGRRAESHQRSLRPIARNRRRNSGHPGLSPHTRAAGFHLATRFRTARIARRTTGSPSSMRTMCSGTTSMLRPPSGCTSTTSCGTSASCGTTRSRGSSSSRSFGSDSPRCSRSRRSRSSTSTRCSRSSTLETSPSTACSA